MKSKGKGMNGGFTPLQGQARRSHDNLEDEWCMPPLAKAR